MAEHIEDVRTLLDRYELDVLVVRSRATKRWMHTLIGSGCSVVLTHTQSFLVVDPRYAAEARSCEKDLSVVELPNQSSQTLWEWLCDWLAREQLCRVGLEAEISLAVDTRRLESRGFFVELLVGDVPRLRMIKTPGEIDKIRQAVALGEDVLLSVVPRVHVGMTEQAIASLVYQSAIEKGAQGLAFETVCTTGPRTALPHGRPTERRLARGEHVMLDFGVVLDGFQSDMTRCIYSEPPTGVLAAVHHAVAQAQQAGISAMRVGAAAHDVDAAARAVLIKAGYGDAFVHGLGHGIGVDNATELPLLRQTSDDVLAEGMVMSCEPGVYLPDVGGVRLEDVVAVVDGIGVSLNILANDPIVLEAS